MAVVVLKSLRTPENEVKVQQDEKRKLSDKIVALWLHFWLKRIAKKYPDFFNQMLSDLLLSPKEKAIMKARYKYGLKFKQIPKIAKVELRQVHRLHQSVIDKIIHL